MTTRSRIAGLDVARGIALVAMGIYHFGWDLQMFGYLEPGAAETGVWKGFARVIATSFLFLVGIGLVLAHENGVNWPRFWRRWLMIAAAAAAVSLATWFIFPDAFVFFGILHHIAFASLAGLLFLRFHPALLVVLAICAFFLPRFISGGPFESIWMLWTGLAGFTIRSNDFVPVFPWFAAVLSGMAAAKSARRAGWPHPDMAPSVSQSAPGRALAFLGRHSLVTYLVHQPVLIGLVWLATQIMPPSVSETAKARFETDCIQSCALSEDEAACQRFCGCVVTNLQRESMLDAVVSGRMDPNTGAAGSVVAACTSEMNDVTTPR